MAAFWEQDAVVAPQGGPRPVFTAPDPVGEEDRARDVRDEDRANRTEQRQIDEQAFDRAAKLRTEFLALPDVKAFNEVRNATKQVQALASGEGSAMGDLAIVFSYMKTLDPGSVVREGEFATAQNAAGVPGQIRNAYNRLVSGERLSPEQRQDMASTAQSILESRASGYNDLAQIYRGLIETEGFNPDDHGVRMFEAAPPQVPGGWTREQSIAQWGQELFDAQGNPLGPEGGYAYDAQGNEVGLVGRVTDDTPGAPVALGPDGKPRLTGDDPAYAHFAAGVGDIVQGVGDVVGIVANPLNRGINEVFGTNLSTDLGETIRSDALGLPHGHPTAEVINRAIAGGFVPAAAAARLSGALPGMARTVASELGAAPLRDAAAGAGAGMAGEAVRAMGGGPVAQTVAMLAGGGAGAVAGGRLPAAARQAAPAAPVQTTRTPAERYAAGQRYGIDMSVGDAGPMGSRAVERVLDAQPASASIMDASRERLAGQVVEAVDEVAGAFGPTTGFVGMGEAAQQGVKGWRTRFDEVTEKAYNAIPIKPTVTAEKTATVSALRDLTNKITSNPELAGQLTDRRLVNYLDALTPRMEPVPIVRGGMEIGRPLTPVGGDISWNDLKQLRTRIGEEIGQQVLGEGSLKSDLRRLYAALSEDMEATARAQGPKALAAFQRANKLFADGQARLERVWTSLLGKDGERSPEAAAAFVQRIAKEGKGSADLKRLAELRKTLKPEEWGQVSNGMLRLLGQPANSAGRDFQPQTFVRNFDDMAPEAKNLLFGGEGKELRKNLDDFVGVIRDLAENDATRNTSRTAIGLGGTISTSAGGATGALVGNAIGGPVGGLVGVLMGIAGTHATHNSAAKLWTNPRFVRWATGYSKMLKGAARNGGAINPAAHESQMKALSRLAASNTIIAGEARDLQQQLLQQFQLGTRPLAAEAPQTEDRAETAGAAR